MNFVKFTEENVMSGVRQWCCMLRMGKPVWIWRNKWPVNYCKWWTNWEDWCSELSDFFLSSLVHFSWSGHSNAKLSFYAWWVPKFLLETQDTTEGVSINHSWVFWNWIWSFFIEWNCYRRWGLGFVCKHRDKKSISGVKSNHSSKSVGKLSLPGKSWELTFGTGVLLVVSWIIAPQ